jgi:hypothetical protein
LEIVQAARFVSDTNNLAKLDAQPWDDNVKAVARVPAVIKMMNDDLQWTMALGETFLAQDKDVLDMIQTLRGKAQKAGTLQTTPQQIIVVTNMIVQSTVEQRVVVVTNTIVQIQPVNPQVVYVPVYNPYTVYYPPPTYVPNPYAPLITFGVGIAVGAAIAHNSCDYHSGSVYVGHHGAVYTSGSGSYHGGDVHVDHNTTVNNNVNVDRNNNVNSGNRGNQVTPYNKAGTTGAQQKWQPDQKRLSSTTRGGTANTMESRGYGSSSAARPSTQPSTGARPSTGSVGTRPSTDNVVPRPSTGNTGTRPTTAQSPTTRPSTPAPTARPSSPSTSGGGSAFGGMSSGSSSRSFSSRGSSSRSSGGFSGGGRSSGGRSGGGGRR